MKDYLQEQGTLKLNRVTVSKLAHESFETVSRQAGYLENLAKGLTEATTSQKILEVIASVFKAALGADAVSAHVAVGENFHLMYADGCTEDFIQQCRIVPRRLIYFPDPESFEHGVFLGTAVELRKTMPWLSELIERAGRHTVGYAPLIVDQRTLGVIGFSYNSKPLFPSSRSFICLLKQISAQGLDRILLYEKERRARQEAEAANKAKQVFLTNMNHEIRTPVGIIQGFADLLAKYPENQETTHRWASIILRNTRQLNQLIGDVLDLSRIEANKIETECVKFCLQSMLDEIKFVVEEKAKSKPIVFEMNLSNLPSEIESDPTKIRQILINLLDNSVKFTRKGKVSLTVESSEHGVLEFLVSDTGIGISEKDRDKIFDPFYQVTPSAKTLNGSGLGLSIAKRLAEAVSGDVRLRKSNDAGTEFLFQLKCKFGPKADVNMKSCATDFAQHDLASLPILAVDDSEDGLELIRYFLRKANAQVETAENGHEGLRMALSRSYSVILMDIQMPDMTGHDVVKCLRAQGYKGSIIAVTANAITSEREQCFNEGFDDYMTKPIDFKVLISKIQRVAGAAARSPVFS